MKKVFLKIAKTSACLSIALGLALSVSLASAQFGTVDEAQAAVGGGSPACPLVKSNKNLLYAGSNVKYSTKVKVGKKLNAKLYSFEYSCDGKYKKSNTYDGKTYYYSSEKKVTGAKYSKYQWLYYDDVNYKSVKIKGATKSTFTPTADLVGKEIYVSVTTKKAGFKSYKNKIGSFQGKVVK